MFQWSTYDLESWTTSDALTGIQSGKAGPDTLHGSRECSAGYYTDDLNGGADDDIVCGYDCADLLDGAGEDDILCGMLGDGDSQTGGGGHNDYLDYGMGSGQSNDGGPGGNDQCNNDGMLDDPNCESDLVDGECD